MEKLSNKLKELRKNRHLTQSDVAGKLGLQYFTLGKWEQGRAEPSVEDLSRLADFFECSIDYLIGREDDFGNINVVSNTGLSVHEEDMIRKLRALGPLQFKYLQSQIDALYDIEKNKDVLKNDN